MTEVARNKGFTSSESIQISQELDKLLNLYEKNKYLEKKNDKISRFKCKKKD